MLFWIRVGSYTVAFVFGCAFVGALWRADIKDLKLTYAEAFNQAEIASNERARVLEESISSMDKKHTEDLRRKEDEVKSLRNDVAAGRKRLLVNATCNSSTEDPSGSTGLGNATRPELGREAEQTYFSLREDLTVMQKQLEAAQDILRAEREHYE